MNIAQRAFAGGELAPSLYARTDQQKYALGLRTCRNLFVQKHGGAANRPGTKYIAEVKTSSQTVRLVKFVFNASQTYVMEFGDQYIRWYQDGAQKTCGSPATWADVTAYVVGDLVVDTGVNYYCISAHTSAAATDRPGSGSAWATRWYALTGSILEIPTPYAEADLPALQFSQSADVITIVHPSYVPRELSRLSDTKWTLAAIAFGPSIAKPTNVSSTGGSAGVITYWAVTAIKEATFEESLPGLRSAIDDVPSAGSPTTLSWDLVPGAISYNVYRSTDGTTYGFIGSGSGVATAQSDTSWSDTNEVASSAVAGSFVAAAGQCRNPLAAITATVRAFDGNYTIKCRTTLASGAASTGKTSGRVAVYYLRNTDAARVLAGYFNVDPVTGANQTSGPTALEMIINVPDNGYTTLQIDLVPEVKPASGGSVCSMTVDTSAAPNNAVEFESMTTGFSDVGAAPDYTIAPPTQPANFDAIDRYPSCVTYAQQRLLLANTNTDPEMVFGSRIASFKSFALSTPLQDDDALRFQMAGNQVNLIRHLLELGRILVFTSGGEYVAEGDEAGILRPDTINPRQLSYNGASSVRPVVVGDSALYIQARGSLIRDLKPIHSPGQLGSYEGTDLSVCAQHLFAGYTIDDWDFALVPNSIVWAVRSDGTLLGLTYLREHGIWGWHRHDTDGEFENVCVVPEGNEDSVYVVVKRTINGSTKRYVERMESRQFTDTDDCWFVDCGKLRDGAPTVTITGLDHLEAKNVTVVADGVVLHNPNDPALSVKTVSGGQITIVSSSKVLVGLPYIADLETLDIDSADGKSIKESKFIVGRIGLMVEKSRGFHLGRSGTQTGGDPIKNLQPYKGYASTTELITEDIDVPIESGYDTHGRVFVRQVNPLPLTVLAVIPIGNFGEAA